MSMRHLQDVASEAYSMARPFVLFSEPNSDSITAYIADKEATKMAIQKRAPGFVFAPFNKKSKSYFISSQDGMVLHSALPDVASKIRTTSRPVPMLERDKYIALIARTISFIRTSSSEKIVMSRRQELQLTAFNLTILIESLFSLFGDAFRYLWFHPETGLWCGATPELLLKTEHAEFSSMALAGTQAFIKGKIPVWGEKEKMEQQLVTEDILDQLTPLTEQLHASEPFDQKAGNLWHLRTDIKGRLKPNVDVFNLVDRLHPTPAVCGTPRDVAFKFVRSNENYEREFYTGYLGTVNANRSKTKLFVNLRCMRVEHDKAFVFVGGGITKDSVAELEWEETCKKLQTMTKVLSPFL